MNRSRLLTMILIVTSMMLSMSAQEEPSKKKGKFDFGLGLNFFGPASQMAECMNKYGYNYTLWPDEEHPYYFGLGFTFQTSYSHYLGSRSQLGILFHFASLGQANGFSGISGELNVKFTNISVVPLYRIDATESVEIQVGPALMINFANVVFGDNYTKMSLGLLSGLRIKIWSNRTSYGKISTQYLFTIRNKIGPFTDTVTFPECKIGFSHLTLLFVLGWHL